MNNETYTFTRRDVWNMLDKCDQEWFGDYENFERYYERDRDTLWLDYNGIDFTVL